MKIIFFGTPKFVVPILEILNKAYDVIAVVTAADKPVGRNHTLTPSPVKQFALQHNIPVLTPEKISDAISQLSTLNPQLFIVAAYGKIIPQSILELPKHGAINIHPSSLPKYRGPSPITQTILNGDKESAISFMLMDEKMDHGPILKTIPYEISNTATTESLTHDMFQQAAELLPQVIEDFAEGKIKPQPQDDDKATYTHMITKQDGFINLSQLENFNELEIRNLKLEIARKIRAYYPWPTVWGKVRIKNQELRIKFLPPYVCHSRERGNPEGINNLSSERFCIQLEGGKPMPAKDFLNGYPEMKKIIEKIL